jgi:hypothetical protein
LNVTVDGASIGAPSSYTFSNVTANHTITATFSNNTYTITASAGAGGSISPSGSTSINHGANLAFTITPSADYSIADVTVDGVSRGTINSYTFSNVAANHTISATFKTNSLTIGSSASTGGTISPSGNIAVPYGASQTFTITPDSGYVILNVLIDGSSVGAVRSYTFSNVTSSHAISATFVPGYALMVTTSGSGSGYVVASPSAAVYAPGTKVTLRATRDKSSIFSGFSGDCSGNKPSCTFIINKNASINAIFEQKSLSVRTTALGNGTVSVEGFVSINNEAKGEKVKKVVKVRRSKHYTYIDYGGQLVYRINPEPGHYVKKIFVDGKKIEATDTLTFADIKRNHRVRVRFASETESIPQTSLNVVGKQIFLQDEGGGHPL